MKPLLKTLLPILMLLPVGCVRSIHPAYTDETIEFNPALVGAWTGEEDARLEVIADDEGKGYRITYTEEGKPAKLIAMLSRLTPDLLVLDLTADPDALPESENYRVHLMPLHSFFFVEIGDDEIALRAIKPKWLADHLQENPQAVEHTGSDNEILLTAPTEQLRPFLIQCAQDPEALGERTTFKRAEASAVP